MTYRLPLPRFDPERYARRLAPAGAAFALAGAWVGGGVGFGLAADGVLLLLLAATSRQDGLLVLGPFVRAELVRATRTNRPWFHRTVYAVALGALLVGNVYAFAPEALGWNVSEVRAARMANAAWGIAGWFAPILLGYVGLLTVQVIAPVVAEEREAKRWDLLLTTDLRGREILFGKVAGRLPVVLDPLLAAVPVMAVIPMLGGISPPFVLGFAAVLLATVAGLTGVSMLATVSVPTSRRAIRYAFKIVLLYLVITGLLNVVRGFTFLWMFPLSAGIRWFPFDVGDAVEAASAGNPVVAALSIAYYGTVGTASLEVVFLDEIRTYVAFHLGVLFVCGLIAVGRVRTPVGREARIAGVPAKRKGKRNLKADAAELRPPVGKWPVYYWERYGGLTASQLLRANRILPIRFAVGWAIGFFALAQVMGVLDWWNRPVGVTVIWLYQVFLWIATFPFMLGPLFQAARSVAAERATGTLDGLRLTALSGRDILFQKWAGCVLSWWPQYKSFVVAAAVGAAVDFMRWDTVWGLAALLPVYVGAAAGFGLVFSVRAKNAGQASLMAAAGATLTVYAVTQLFTRVYAKGIAGEMAGLGTIPPFATAIAVWHEDMPKILSQPIALTFPGVIASPLLYALVGGAAWLVALRLFNRDGPRRSEGE